MVEVEYSVARELLLLIYNKELVEVEQEFWFICLIDYFNAKFRFWLVDFVQIFCDILND